MTQEQMNQMAKEMRESASNSRKSARESFDRCDTDGFVSQWASNINADLLSTKAGILENGGMAEMAALLDGERVLDAKQIPTKYGVCWLLEDAEAEKYGRRFIPFGRNSRIQKKLGLHQDFVMKLAWAAISGSGTGLAGAATCRVEVYERDWEITEYTR